jgi:hypothetical protein
MNTENQFAESGSSPGSPRVQTTRRDRLTSDEIKPFANSSRPYTTFNWDTALRGVVRYDSTLTVERVNGVRVGAR